MKPSRRAAVEAFGKAVQRYQRSTQAFDDAVGRTLDLGSADLRCLDWLSEGPMTAGELAKATGLRPAATTALVDRLTRRGLVRRRPSQEDRRKVLIELSEDGRGLIWEMYGPLVRDGQSLLEGLSVDEVAAFAALLDKMSANTEKHVQRVTSREPNATK